MFDEYKMNLPEGSAGQWQVSKFVVDDAASRFTSFRAALKGRGYVPPGTYTQLTRSGTIVMSDTPDEIADHLAFIHRVHGICLINGLGLGMAVNAALRKPNVTHVYVVEQSADVISLVEPTYKKITGTSSPCCMEMRSPTSGPSCAASDSTSYGTISGTRFAAIIYRR